MYSILLKSNLAEVKHYPVVETSEQFRIVKIRIWELEGLTYVRISGLLVLLVFLVILKLPLRSSSKLTIAIGFGQAAAGGGHMIYS